MSRAPLLEALRTLARYQTHPGYVWAMVADDGELVCTPCVRANYRKIFRDTRDNTHSGWCCMGIIGSDSHESETDECCAHCGKVMFEAVTP